jgi:hypothetical protein
MDVTMTYSGLRKMGTAAFFLKKMSCTSEENLITKIKIHGRKETNYENHCAG